MAKEPEGANRCKVCHAAEVEGFARSAMAHSLRRASQEPAGTVAIPNGKITAYSVPTGSWQRLETGGAISNFQIDFVIGSGNHASGYLVDVAGHLFQSPIAFYKSRNSYDLAPGYEKTQDPDFTRPVAEGCVFCHAGSALHISGTDNQYAIRFSRMKPSVASDATVPAAGILPTRKLARSSIRQNLSLEPATAFASSAT